MFRDVDPRPHEPERPDPSRGSRGGHERPERPDHDVRGIFARDLDLPRGPERERVWSRSREYALNGSEARTLAAVGAFRVVPAADLEDGRSQPLTIESTELRHLRDLGLVKTSPYVVGRGRTALVTLSKAARDLLEGARGDGPREREQAFYAGIVKPRELSHDVQFFRAYLRAVDRLTRSGARPQRVVLDYELKRDYQRFLQSGARGRDGRSRRERREAEAIAEWAHEHHLPMLDDHVQFPDVRIEYEDRDGRREIEDIEVMTPHYRGAMAAAKAAAGFSRYGGVAARIGGRGGASGGGSPHPRVIEEVLE